MSKKTRKHIRPVSLVMALAIIVTLSGIIVLATNPGGVQAQEDCSNLSPDERDLVEAFGGGVRMTPPVLRLPPRSAASRSDDSRSYDPRPRPEWQQHPQRG